MKRFGLYALCVLWVVCMQACSGTGSPDEIRKEHFVFAVKGADTLSLDKYELSSLPVPATGKPVMIFAFGGGFRGGDKASQSYLPYFEYLVRQGFVVVSIDYRTVLKDLNPAEVSDPMQFMQVLQRAIGTAVEDFYDATRFVVERSADWGIDTKQILASGSSAGAITVLQAEYVLCNGQPLAERLPAGFNYAGVIAFAGAVADNVAPHWTKAPCPILLFHGDADRIVPFRQAAMEGLGGLWGSAAIAESLDRLETPYSFHKIENAGHEISEIPMQKHLLDILNFFERQVRQGERLVIESDERIPGDTAVKKDFTVMDYLFENTH